LVVIVGLVERLSAPAAVDVLGGAGTVELQRVVRAPALMAPQAGGVGGDLRIVTRSVEVLEQSDLSSRPLRRWPTPEAVRAWLPRTIVEVVLASLALGISFALIQHYLWRGAPLQLQHAVELAPAGAAVVVPERFGQLVFESGLWFDERSVGMRRLLERLCIFLGTFVFVPCWGLVLAIVLDQTVTEVAVLAAMLSVTSVLLSLACSLASDTLRWLTRKGFGGSPDGLPCSW